MFNKLKGNFKCHVTSSSYLTTTLLAAWRIGGGKLDIAAGSYPLAAFSCLVCKQQKPFFVSITCQSSSMLRRFSFQDNSALSQVVLQSVIWSGDAGHNSLGLTSKQNSPKWQANSQWRFLWCLPGKQLHVSLNPTTLGGRQTTRLSYILVNRGAAELSWSKECASCYIHTSHCREGLPGSCVYAVMWCNVM